MEFWSFTTVELEAVKLSLQVALLAVACSLPLAILVSFILARYDFPLKFLLDSVVHLPLVLPPVVMGYLLLVVFGKNGIVGKVLWENFGISVAFTWKGAALAAGIMAFPLLVRSIRISVESMDNRLVSVAHTLGAGKVRVFFTIILPLAAPGILTGSILAFARCLGEFGATITFVSNIPGETRTLPLAIYTLVQSPGGELAALKLCIVAVVISIIALYLSQRISDRIGNKSPIV